MYINQNHKAMKAYDENKLNSYIEEAINEQNHFWWGCVIGLQYGRLYSIRVNEDEEPSYCVDTEERKANTFQPIVRVKYGSPYKGREPKGHVVSWYGEDHNPVNVAYLRIKPEPVIFETGATKHYINSLILYTDNTRSLVELRDEIYESNRNESVLTPIIFESLCDAARYQFLRENGYESVEAKPIDKMRYKKYSSDVMEFCQIYANRFDNWKLEH